MKRLLRYGLPFVILIAAGAGAATLAQNRAVATQEEPTLAKVIVDVQTIELADLDNVVEASGTVAAAQTVDLVPEVNGRVVWSSSKMRPGGRVKKGQVLLRIDPRDYDAAIVEAEGRLAEAKANLQIEINRQRVAKKEWTLLGPKAKGRASAAALREPQRAVADARVQQQQAALTRAQTNRKRTVVRAPFDALITAESIERGQWVAAGQRLATLAGVDQAWVTALVPGDSIDDVGVLEASGGLRGRPATVRSRMAVGDETRDGAPATRTGRVLGLAGEVDRSTRTVPVLVEVAAPLDPTRGPVLLPGSFVDVELPAVTIQNAVSIPAAAVRSSEVWVVDEDERLARRVVIVHRRARGQATVTGLDEGDRVVLTRLTNPLDGMAVEVREQADQGASS